MKKNKPRTINEGFLDALLGDVGAAGLSSIGSGTTTQQQLAQSLFIKDFIGDAIVSLSNGIKTGVVNPNLESSSPEDEVKPTPRQSPGRMAQKTQARMQAQRTTAAQKPKPIAENTTYARLNLVFESIISEMDGGTQNISDFLLDWFATYMHGINWQPRQGVITNLIKAVEQAYFTDQGKIGSATKKAMQLLAQGAYSIAKTSKGTPDGAKNMATPTETTELSAEQLKQAAATLKRTNPTAYVEFINSLKATSIAESRRYRR